MMELKDLLPLRSRTINFTLWKDLPRDFEVLMLTHNVNYLHVEKMPFEVAVHLKEEWYGTYSWQLQDCPLYRELKAKYEERN